MDDAASWKKRHAMHIVLDGVFSRRVELDARRVTAVARTVRVRTLIARFASEDSPHSACVVLR